jgi:YVTN family beta-propeller protein
MKTLNKKKKLDFAIIKLIMKHGILPFVFLLFLLLMYHTHPVIGQLDSNSLRIYEDADTGVKFQYPKFWEKKEKEGSDHITFNGKSNIQGSDISESFILSISNYEIRESQSEGYSLAELSSNSSHTGLQLSYFQPLRSDKLSRENYPVDILMFKAKKDDKEMRGIAMRIIGDNKQYDFLYVASVNEYHIQLPIVFEIIDSFIKMTLKKNSLELHGLSVGSHPRGIIFNPNNNLLYITNSFSNTVTVLDTETDKIVANIPVGTTPQSIAVNPQDNRIYVVNTGSNDVSAIDGSTNTVIGTTKVGNSPTGIAVDHIGVVYVANWFGHNASIIEDAIDVPLSTRGNISIGPSQIGISSDFYSTYGNVYVAYRDGIAVIDSFLSEEPAYIIPITDVRDIEINSAAGELYVGTSKNIQILEELNYEGYLTYNKVGRGIKVDYLLDKLLFNPNTNLLYVTYFNSNILSIINLTRSEIIRNITLETGNFNEDDILYNSLTINTKNNLIYVASESTDKVYVIDGTTNDITAGVTFKTQPQNAGKINCGRNNIENNDYIRLSIFRDISCKAMETDGYVFSGWSGEINAKSAGREITFNVPGYNKTVIANFAEAIPKEYFENFYNIVILTVLIPTVAGWLLPFVVDHLSYHRQRSYLRKYIQKVDDVYANFNNDKIKCLHKLDAIKTETMDLLQRGKINESHYDILNQRIESYAGTLQ